MPENITTKTTTTWKLKLLRFPEDLKVRCGWGPISTGTNDPFLEACAAHDRAFDENAKGDRTETLDQVNIKLTDDMLVIAEKEQSYWTKTGLMWRAAVYGTIAGALGWMFWNK